ncbi:Ipl1p [Rhizophagus irregularis DAOM 197198w]|uniref:Ipl1p n=1 Tax=Rhizophagus irregularis (strain DAOM 197198w) TaxID=1432141 RepID=A0A015JX07_RHIIW|nr:Ipl1p [Rhizophagus irregularis DAOM 197198w]
MFSNYKAHAALIRAISLIDYNIYDDIHKQYEFLKQTLLAEKSLTENDKSVAIKLLNHNYDENRINRNEGTKEVCKNCNQECLAITYCEHCIRNYLKANFSNWTSKNDEIDNLIQECQIKSRAPDGIIEWIPYINLQNINYLTKGGFSEIYTANWIDGKYDEWDTEGQQLKRFGEHDVVFKKLEGVESTSQSWFEEAKSHLNISNKFNEVVPCFGLTKDPSNGNYMLVMYKMDIDLRKYLQQNHNQLTWTERIKIAVDIIDALLKIHVENAIHRDLHSGNILYNFGEVFRISDLGFCGPADKPLKSIYGNLPYIAPEVIIGKEQTFKSDIYSIAMLMWEVSSGQPPFIDYEHDYDLAMNIVNGMRPKIVPGTPLEYKNLMKQCWDADPSKRPYSNTLWNKIHEINLFYQNESNESLTQSEESNNFEIERLPEPKNATEEEQEAFHSKSYKFYIPDNVSDFDKSNSQKNNTSKVYNILKDTQNDYKIETIEKKTKILSINDNDEDEIYNNPNFHSEEQDEFELPDSEHSFV